MGEPYFQKREFMDNNQFCVYSSNYNLYGDMSDRVMSVIKQFVKKLEIYSIDECFIDVSDIDDHKLHETLIAIKDEVKRLTGIPVSIGVGPNKTIAKLVSKIAKKQPSYDGVCSYWDIKDFKSKCETIPLDDVWGIGRQWSKKLKKLGIENVLQFSNLHENLVKKLLNINGLRTLMEIKGDYCYEIIEKSKTKKNVASARSFGQDINSFEQISEAMYTYIHNGLKKLNENELSPNQAVIFINGNYHKNQKHYASKLIRFHKQTNNINEIWSQVYPHLKSIYDETKTYKKCGIIFNHLIPQEIQQGVLFDNPIQSVNRPINKEKKWLMKQEYKSPKYTTDWNQIPKVFS